MNGGPFRWDFSTSILSQNSEKLKGAFGERFFEKSLAMPKKTERGTFWSRPVLYVTRKTFLDRFFLKFKTRNCFHCNTEMILYLVEKEDRFGSNIILYVDFVFFKKCGEKEKEPTLRTWRKYQPNERHWRKHQT